jgi:hypothetical protein
MLPSSRTIKYIEARQEEAEDKAVRAKALCGRPEPHVARPSREKSSCIFPAGAWITWQILPNPSVYSFAGMDGSVRIKSEVKSAVVRDGWTLSIAIIGVGCKHSYEIL